MKFTIKDILYKFIKKKQVSKQVPKQVSTPTPKKETTIPLMRCKKNGKLGWKWGKSGTCYIGNTGKAKATAQGVAIQKSKGVKRSNEQLEF